MNTVSKSIRELYANIRSELIQIHYRRLLVKQLFTSQEINDLLNRSAIRFFTTLKWDLLDMIVIAISRLTDPAKSLNKFHNASLHQLIQSLDTSTSSEIIQSLTEIFSQIKRKSSRIEYWRKKWAAHRDMEVVQGLAPKPAISLIEVDEVLTLIGKFIKEFERVYQDTKVEINLYDNQFSVEELDEMERLKIHTPIPYENVRFLPDDGNTIIEFLNKAHSKINPG